MTTLTLLDNGFIQIPQNILKLFSLKKGDTLEVNTSPKHLIIEPVNIESSDTANANSDFVLDEQTKALIEQSFGMFKVEAKSIKYDIDDLDMGELAKQFYDEKDLTWIH